MLGAGDAVLSSPFSDSTPTGLEPLESAACLSQVAAEGREPERESEGEGRPSTITLLLRSPALPHVPQPF